MTDQKINKTEESKTNISKTDKSSISSNSSNSGSSIKRSKNVFNVRKYYIHVKFWNK